MAETTSPVAGVVPLFVIVICRAFPVKGALSVGGGTLLLNVVASGAVVRVITNTSLKSG